MTNDFHIEQIPYGTTELTLRIPKANYLGTLFPTYHPGVRDEKEEILRALNHPIGTQTFKEIARSKKGRKTVVVVNDGSRPTVTYKMLPPLMEELTRCGIEDSDINIIIATGTHRDVRPDEFTHLFGKEMAERYRIINHNCQDPNIMVNLGTTSQGVPIIINREYCEADIKILTGSIHPHQGAGFSGGRKSVLPGLTSLETLKLHHSYKFRSPEPAMGWLEGNPFHLAAMEAAKATHPDFILNLVQNQKKEITHAVAGDLEEAWLAGVQASKEIFETETPLDVDVVVIVPGGHPRDGNLYQSQKSMSTAELVVKKGGSIYLPAACPDGIGSELFYEWMDTADCPEDVMERFKREAYNVGTSKAWMYSRCILRAELIIISDCLDEQTLGRMFTRKAPDLDSAIQMALEKQGRDAKILVLRNAADMIPVKKF